MSPLKHVLLVWCWHVRTRLILSSAEIWLVALLVSLYFSFTVGLVLLLVYNICLIILGFCFRYFTKEKNYLIAITEAKRCIKRNQFAGDQLWPLIEETRRSRDSAKLNSMVERFSIENEIQIVRVG